MRVAIPAVILCEPRAGEPKIAALTLLDRLVVAVHRGGCHPITIVCRGETPPLRRSTALGIVPRNSPSMTVLTEPTLLADANFLVSPSDVRRVVESGSRLTGTDDEPLPIGVVSAFTGDLQKSLAGLPEIRAEKIAAVVKDAPSAHRAEAALWASLTSSTDGKVDVYFNRPVGRYLSKLLIHTPITPNQISILSMLIGLAAAWYFQTGVYAATILGAVLLQVSAIVDCVDGDIARILFKESPLGKWLDITADQIVHLAVFAGIAVGLARQNSDAPELALGISAVVGVLISFGVVLRGMLRPGPVRNARLERLIDTATSRDFSVLLLALAIFGKLEWFLWITAIGVHFFWVTALVLQLAPIRRAESAASPRP